MNLSDMMARVLVPIHAILGTSLVLTMCMQPVRRVDPGRYEADLIACVQTAMNESDADECMMGVMRDAGRVRGDH
jgi:hypothetical protein